MSHSEHKAQAQKKICCAVITCSDSRTHDSDMSGKTIMQLLEREEHLVDNYQIVKDEPSLIRSTLEDILQLPTMQAVIITGGTGISKRDSTYETIISLLEKRLDGFGELFRVLSYEQIGSAAIMSRATAGIARGKVVFSIPGSQKAVSLAMEKLILPELPHIVSEINR